MQTLPTTNDQVVSSSTVCHSSHNNVNKYTFQPCNTIWFTLLTNDIILCRLIVDVGKVNTNTRHIIYLFLKDVINLEKNQKGLSIHKAVGSMEVLTNISQCGRLRPGSCTREHDHGYVHT